MDREEVFAKLAAIFEDVLDLDDPELSEATSGDDIEDWDSLANVRLMVAVEKAFGIELTTDEMADIETLGDIVDLVVAKKG